MLGFLLFLYIAGIIPFSMIVFSIARDEDMGIRDTLIGVIFYPIWIIPTLLFYVCVLIHALWTNNTFDKSWDIIMSKKIFIELLGEKEK